MTKYYKNNFLTEVLFKIEFPVLLGLKQFISEFQILIRDRFPDLEEQPFISLPKDIKSEDILSIFSQDKLWKFKSLSGEKFIELSKTHLLYCCKKYAHFKEFNENIEFIISSFKKIYGENIIIKKTGLRYVNNIEISKGNPFEWGEYIKTELVSATNKFVKDKKIIKRSIQIIEIKENEFDIHFQFGMPNPDHPNPITKKLFLLDFDCVSQEPIKLQDIGGRLIESHNHVEELFEDCIMDGLRKEMVVIKDDE